MKITDDKLKEVREEARRLKRGHFKDSENPCKKEFLCSQCYLAEALIALINDVLKSNEELHKVIGFEK